MYSRACHHRNHTGHGAQVRALMMWLLLVARVTADLLGSVNGPTERKFFVSVLSASRAKRCRLHS